ncbi:MAG: hypothetical protein OSJ69_17645 [Acetatifactor sp.]|nr:hypothetical protein [Acetatifactor sp.]
MKPYNVEIFTQDFEMVGNANVNEITYKEDYLSSDDNTVTVLALPGIRKQDYIRINRGQEEYAGIVTEIGYGTDKSKKLQTISYKPLMELLNTDVLFDVDLQGQGSMEQFICDRIKEMFINNTDEKQNIKGLSVTASTNTTGWGLHITPSEKGGHYNIVNLIDSVIIPAMKKYGIIVKAGLDIQSRTVHMVVGKAAAGIVTIESDLPNIIQKNVTIKQVSADVNKLVLFDAKDYGKTRTYYLHPDLGYDTKDFDRIIPVICEMQAVSYDEGGSFESAAMEAAYNKFANLSYSNLIELTMRNGDTLVRPEEMEFGQVVNIISDGVAYESILTGRERGKNTKLVFGTVRLDLTKILRRQENG